MESTVLFLHCNVKAVATLPRITIGSIQQQFHRLLFPLLGSQLYGYRRLSIEGSRFAHPSTGTLQGPAAPYIFHKHSPGSSKMSGFHAHIPEPYPSPRVDLLSQMPAIITYTPRKSVTMEEDKSQPPTPDGSGLPVNFAQVGPGVYRASYPQAVHFSALQPLKLRTIITLVPGAILSDYQSFMHSEGITHHQIHVLANKDPEVYTTDEVVNSIIKLMLDPTNHPILVHCNKGKHRTGCLMACFRKVTGWSLEACLAEYEKYAKPKVRALDKDFIARFDASVLKPLALERG